MAQLFSESLSVINQNSNVADKVLSGCLMKDRDTSCACHEVMHDLCKAACFMHRRLSFQFRSYETTSKKNHNGQQYWR